LSQESAATRLQEHDCNVLPSRKPEYWKKLLGYVFGGFCSILEIGVMVFFICWGPLGDPDLAPYNLGPAILVFYGYSEDELTAFNVTGQSVYFVTLVILQLGNIHSIRNKRMNILQADPIRKKRRNPWLVLSAIISISIVIFVTEKPGLQSLRYWQCTNRVLVHPGAFGSWNPGHGRNSKSAHPILPQGYHRYDCLVKKC
jgi:magnesium-transporting ATPase (P-type)